MLSVETNEKERTMRKEASQVGNDQGNGGAVTANGSEGGVPKECQREGGQSKGPGSTPKQRGGGDRHKESEYHKRGTADVVRDWFGKKAAIVQKPKKRCVKRKGSYLSQQREERNKHRQLVVGAPLAPEEGSGPRLKRPPSVIVKALESPFSPPGGDHQRGGEYPWREKKS